jgi:hypothetical protein
MVFCGRRRRFTVSNDLGRDRRGQIPGRGKRRCDRQRTTVERGREAGGSLRGNKRGVALIYIRQDGGTRQHVNLRSTDTWEFPSNGHRTRLLAHPRVGGAALCITQKIYTNICQHAAVALHLIPDHSLSFSLHLSIFCPVLSRSAKGPGSMLSLLPPYLLGLFPRFLPVTRRASDSVVNCHAFHDQVFRRFFETTSRRKIC